MRVVSSPRSQLTKPRTTPAPSLSVSDSLEPTVMYEPNNKLASNDGYCNPSRIAPIPDFVQSRCSSRSYRFNRSETSGSCVSTSAGISFFDSSESFGSEKFAQVRHSKEKWSKPADDTSSQSASASKAVTPKAGAKFNSSVVDRLGISIRGSERRTERGDVVVCDSLSRSLSPSSMEAISAARAAAADAAAKVAAAVASRQGFSPASDNRSVRPASPRTSSLSPRPSLAAARSTHKARVGAEERSKRFSVSVADRLHVVKENCTPRRR